MPERGTGPHAAPTSDPLEVLGEVELKRAVFRNEPAIAEREHAISRTTAQNGRRFRVASAETCSGFLWRCSRAASAATAAATLRSADWKVLSAVRASRDFFLTFTRLGADSVHGQNKIADRTPFPRARCSPTGCCPRARCCPRMLLPQRMLLPHRMLFPQRMLYPQDVVPQSTLLPETGALLPRECCRPRERYRPTPVHSCKRCSPTGCCCPRGCSGPRRSSRRRWSCWS